MRCAQVVHARSPETHITLCFKDPLKQTSLVTRPTDTQMNVNISYQDMMLPMQGPENPFGDRNRFPNIVDRDLVCTSEGGDLSTRWRQTDEGARTHRPYGGSSDRLRE